jgi:hypothetical protein
VTDGGKSVLVHRRAIRRATKRRDVVAAYGEAAIGRVEQINAEITEYADDLEAASNQVRVRLQEPAIRALPAGRVEQEHAEWLQQQAEARKATVDERTRHPTARHHEFQPSYGITPDRGHGIGR